MLTSGYQDREIGIPRQREFRRKEELPFSPLRWPLPPNLTSVLQYRQGLCRPGHHHPCRQWWGRGGQHMTSWDTHSIPFPMPQPLLAFPLPGEPSLVFPRAASSPVLASQLAGHFSGEACSHPSLAPLSSPCLLPSWQSQQSLSGKFIDVLT